MPPMNNYELPPIGPLGVQMTKSLPQLPTDYFINIQRQNMQKDNPNFGQEQGNQIASLIKMLQGSGSGFGVQGLLGNLGTSQNLGLNVRETPSMSPENIGGLLGSGMNTQFASPGMLYAMQNMGR